MLEMPVLQNGGACFEKGRRNMEYTIHTTRQFYDPGMHKYRPTYKNPVHTKERHIYSCVLEHMFKVYRTSLNMCFPVLTVFEAIINALLEAVQFEWGTARAL